MARSLEDKVLSFRAVIFMCGLAAALLGMGWKFFKEASIVANDLIHSHSQSVEAHPGIERRLDRIEKKIDRLLERNRRSDFPLDN